jgi:hypothetical protein
MFVYASLLGKLRRFAATLKIADCEEPPPVAVMGGYFAAVHLNRERARTAAKHDPRPPIHAAFSEVSPAVDPTIMQAAGHLHNLGIMFSRVFAHPILETAMDMLIETQSKFDDSQRESPKSEIAMVIEMGIALIAAFGLLAMGAWVLYSTHDWISSIQRFQQMI